MSICVYYFLLSKLTQKVKVIVDTLHCQKIAIVYGHWAVRYDRLGESG